MDYLFITFINILLSFLIWCFVLIIKGLKNKKLFKKDFISSASYDEQTKELIINYQSGKIEKYSGSCTVWHKMPYMKRCGTFKESFLCDIWSYTQKYGNPYPTAHNKQN